MSRLTKPELEARVRQLEAELEAGDAEADVRIRELEQKVANRDEQIAELSSERDSRAEGLAEQIAELKSENDRLGRLDVDRALDAAELEHAFAPLDAAQLGELAHLRIVADHHRETLTRAESAPADRVHAFLRARAVDLAGVLAERVEVAPAKIEQVDLHVVAGGE